MARLTYLKMLMMLEFQDIRWTLILRLNQKLGTLCLQFKSVYWSLQWDSFIALLALSWTIQLEVDVLGTQNSLDWSLKRTREWTKKQFFSGIVKKIRTWCLGAKRFGPTEDDPAAKQLVRELVKKNPSFGALASRPTANGAAEPRWGSRSSQVAESRTDPSASSSLPWSSQVVGTCALPAFSRTEARVQHGSKVASGWRGKNRPQRLWRNPQAVTRDSSRRVVVVVVVRRQASESHHSGVYKVVNASMRTS